MFCNAGFGTLLGIDPDSSLAETRLRDIITACQARFPQSTLWPSLERQIATGAPLSERIALAQGAGQLDLRHLPLGRGNTMLSLCHHEPKDAALMQERTG